MGSPTNTATPPSGTTHKPDHVAYRDKLLHPLRTRRVKKEAREAEAAEATAARNELMLRLQLQRERLEGVATVLSEVGGLIDETKTARAAEAVAAAEEQLDQFTPGSDDLPALSQVVSTAEKEVEDVLANVDPDTGAFCRALSRLTTDPRYPFLVAEATKRGQDVEAQCEALRKRAARDPKGAGKELQDLSLRWNGWLDEAEELQGQLDVCRTKARAITANKKMPETLRDSLSPLLASAGEAINKGTQAQRARELMAEVNALIQEAGDDPKAAKGLEPQAAFLAKFTQLEELYPAAQDYNDSKLARKPVATLAADFQKAVQHRKNKEYTPQAVEEVDALLKTVGELLEDAVANWRVAQRDAKEVLQHARRVLAAKARGEAAGGQETAEQKEVREAAGLTLNFYQQAQEAAANKQYGTALHCLEEAVKEGQKVRETAAKLLASIGQPSEREVAEAKEAFHLLGTILGDEFNTNTDALDYQSGVNEEGQPTKSAELQRIDKVYEEALGRWRQLCAAGIDPVSAGEKVFAHIPKNFWPPQAVRAVAMFRRAEEEFAAEERARELEAELAARKSLSVDKAREFLEDTRVKAASQEMVNTVGESMKLRMDEVALEMAKEQLKDKKDVTDKELREKADEIFKGSDLGKASEALMGFASGLGAVVGLVKVGMSAYELGKAISKERSEKQEEISPVQARILEFERNRAIMHLALDLADTLTSAGGAFNQLLPGLGLGSDLKEIAQSIYEAGRYFKLLWETKQIRKGAKKDPETMMHLALTREIRDQRLFAYKNAFMVADKLLALTGGALEVAGSAGMGGGAVAGFAVRKGALALEYCGKFCFTVKDWADASSCKKHLAAARGPVVDYDAVEQVFKESSKFARFAIAWGCVEGNDPWARHYVLNRGIKDHELDHPETSAAIVREFLNVSFEGYMGDRQEDEERGKTFGESVASIPGVKLLGKLKKKKIDGPPYTSLWVGTIDLTPQAWKENWEEAVKDGLEKNSKAFGAIRDRLAAFAEHHQAHLEAQGAFNEAVDSFLAIPNPGEDDRSTFLPALETSYAATSKFLEAAQALAETLQGYDPRHKKGPLHQGMSDLLEALRKEADRHRDEAYDYREVLVQKKYALGRSPEAAAEEQVKEREARKEAKTQEEAERRKVIRDALDEAWEAYAFALPWGKKAVPKDLAEAVTQRLGELGVDGEGQLELQHSVGPVLMTARERAYDYLCGAQHLDLIPDPKQPDKVREKLLARARKSLDKDLSRRLKKEAGYVEEELAKLCSSKLDLANRPEFRFNLVNPSSLDPQDWEANKKLAEAQGWDPKTTHIGSALTAYQEAHAAWDLVKGDINTQADVRVALNVLGQRIDKWVPRIKGDGMIHPTMNRYKEQLWAAVKAAKKEFDRACQEAGSPSTQGSWSPSEGELARWPLTASGWETMQRLAVQNSWDKNSPNGTTRAFKQLDKARERYNAGLTAANLANQGPEFLENKARADKAIKNLLEKLHKFGDKHFKREGDGSAFAGMQNYVKAMTQRLGQFSKNIEENKPLPT